MNNMPEQEVADKQVELMQAAVNLLYEAAMKLYELRQFTLDKASNEMVSSYLTYKLLDDVFKFGPKITAAHRELGNLMCDYERNMRIQYENRIPADERVAIG